MLERMRGASLIRAMLFAALLATILETQASEGCAPDQAKQIQIGGQTFVVEVAASPSERERGLSGRALLKPGTGLWFVFPEPDKYGFWMRDMRFPIDLIWVGPELKVAGAVTLQPCVKRNCSIHYAPSRVAYVLEVNAGEFSGIQGDPVAWRCSRGSLN
jgi:uncharacterized membrane protein (UPF0127 family)